MIFPETSNQSRRLWLFLLVYPLHIIEEIRGVGAFRGINLSLKQFFILSGAACLLMVIGILLAQRFPVSTAFGDRLWHRLSAERALAFFNSVVIRGMMRG